jgi:phosphate transport system substrate-binding protein
MQVAARQAVSAFRGQMRTLPLFTAFLAVLAVVVPVPTSHAGEIKIGGTGAGIGAMRVLGDAFTKANQDLRVSVLPSMGTGGGLKAVAAGAIDVAVSARPLNGSELQAQLNAVEYGRTPLVFATQAASSVSNVTTKELVDIYSGKVDHWPDGIKVRLVLRPAGDADSEAIKGLSEQMRTAASAADTRKGMLLAVTDQETADSLEQVPGVLGLSSAALILSERRAIKSLSLDGVAPTVKNVAEGRYPLVRTLYIVTRSGQPNAQKFLAFVRSKQGREILLQTGHWVR